jgi:hypothetical protein
VRQFRISASSAEALFVALGMVSSVACTTQRIEFVAPQYNQQLTAPLASFFVKTRQQCPIEFDQTFAAVAKSYSTRGYTFEEFSGSLQSLIENATRCDPHLKSVVVRESDVSLTGEQGAEPLILFLNPTCDECARVLRLFVDVEKRSCFQFPPVILRLLPTHEEDSIRASTAIESLRNHRDVFASALLDVLQSVPEGKATLDFVLSPYLKLMPAPDSKEWGDAAGRIESDERALADVDIPPPFGVFRGRRIGRRRSATASFDMFHDPDALILAVLAVNAAEEEGRGCAAIRKGDR